MAVFFLAAAILWTGLGSYGLTEPSDARYAEIGREMWASGEYFLPRLLGIYHFHKPPLMYWLVSAGYSVFGPNEWGARACLGLMGLLLSFILWRFARKHIGPGSAPWMVIFLVTTPAVIGAGRMVTTDLLLTLCLVLAMTGWYDVWSGAGGTFSLVLFYLACAGAFMAKGPVAWLLLLLIIVPFHLLNRSKNVSQVRSWGAARGIPLVMALALPWYLYVIVRIPGLLSYFLGNQLLSRLRQGGMGHPHPWYYFLLLLIPLGLPWILLAPAGWRALRREKSPLSLYLALWALLPLVFFSLPTSKLPLYILPSYPALVLLAGRAMDGPVKEKARLIKALAAFFLILGTSLLVLSTGQVPIRGGDLAAVGPASLFVIFFLPALACLAAGASAFRQAGKRPFLAVLAMAAAMAFIPPWFFSRGDRLPLKTVRVVGRKAARMMRPGDILVEYRTLSSGLPFYAGRIPIMAAVGREILFESGDTEEVLNEQGFQALWSSDDRVLVVTRKSHIQRLDGGQFIAEDRGYVLLVNR